MKRRLMELAGTALLWLLGWSWRFQVEGREHWLPLRDSGQPLVFLFWHSRILPLSHLHRGEGVTVLISQHRDGELIARLVERRGFRTARGSSTRGGFQGLRELLRALRGGGDLALTPDGPRGPARRLKPGALVAAQRGDAPLILVSAGSPGGWRMRSWDRFLVPRPFARVVVRYSPPIPVPRELDPSGFEALVARVDAELNALTDAVDGADPDPARPTGPWRPEGAE